MPFPEDSAANQPITATGSTRPMCVFRSCISDAAVAHFAHSARCLRRPRSARIRNPPLVYAPSRSAYRPHSPPSRSARLTCSWRNACRSPSRARCASTAVAFGVSPSSGATSRGDASSTVVCHSTVCQRSGRLRNARTAIERSASRIARTSAPASSASPPERATAAADTANAAKSSTRCSRRAVRAQSAATRRTDVNR